MLPRSLYWSFVLKLIFLILFFQVLGKGATSEEIDHVGDVVGEDVVERKDRQVLIGVGIPMSDCTRGTSKVP